MEEINWKMFVAPIIILFIFIGGIIGIVNWQKSKKQEEAPSVNVLTVSIPEGEVESREKEFTVSGKAKEDEKVFINGSEVPVDKEGNYSKALVLNEGTNKVVVQSRKDGEVTETVERTVKYATSTPAPQAEQPQAPAASQTPAPVSPAPSNLATSGPEDLIIPVIGAGGIILAIVYYRKSKRTLLTSLRK